MFFFDIFPIYFIFSDFQKIQNCRFSYFLNISDLSDFHTSELKTKTNRLHIHRIQILQNIKLLIYI